MTDDDLNGPSMHTSAVLGPATRRRRGASSAPALRSPQGVLLCAQMLRRGVLGANLALVGAVGLSLAIRGVPGAVNAAVAGAIVLVFLVTGQTVQIVAGERADGTGMAVTLASFGTRVACVGLLLWVALAHWDRVAPHLQRPCFVLGAVAVAQGWVLAVMVTGSRQRVHLYDSNFAPRDETVQGRRQG